MTNRIVTDELCLGWRCLDAITTSVSEVDHILSINQSVRHWRKSDAYPMANLFVVCVLGYGSGYQFMFPRFLRFSL
jgi:hypothetical protein